MTTEVRERERKTQVSHALHLVRYIQCGQKKGMSATKERERGYHFVVWLGSLKLNCTKVES